MISEDMDFSNAQILRNRAEEQLKLKQQDNSISEEISDLKKLLHELQVHQIELEMQNDELREANETTETTLRKYTLLFDLSPIGYFGLNPDGSIRELNFAGAAMLGERPFSLKDSNFKLFVSEDSRPVFNSFFSKVYKSNEKESCKIELSHDNRPLYSVYIEGVVVGDYQICLLCVVDISKFK